MKIIITGMPYFVKDLSVKLNRQDAGNKYIALNTNGKRTDQLKFLWHILFARIVYSVGGDYRKGGVFKIASFLNVKMILHWAGTDVLKARKAFGTNNFDENFINSSCHLCEVAWIRDELKSMNINAEVIPTASCNIDDSVRMSLPKEFSVLTYSAAGSEDFYGLQHILKLADDFPSIEIKIAGLKTYKDPLPSNIKLLGWVDDMSEQYKNCVLFVRMAQHDGLGYSVIEALSHGRYVARSFDFPETFFIENYNDLKQVVQDLSVKHKNNELEINHKGIDFIDQHFNEKKIITDLINFMNNCDEK